jgi:hypothetical protein
MHPSIPDSSLKMIAATILKPIEAIACQQMSVNPAQAIQDICHTSVTNLICHKPKNNDTQ